LARAATLSRCTAGMIVSMPSHEKAWPGFVQALARSMCSSAGRSPKPTRRWKPRVW
jgi:hypothetical protein